MIRWLMARVNFWVIVGGVVIAAGLTAVFALVLVLLPAPTAAAPGSTLQMTVIAAPSITPSPTRVLETHTPTAPPSVGGLSVGSYVQIAGTEGAGLRLRDAPGTSSASRFVAMDSEVFRIKEGPKEADGFTWWYLEAPYDPSRSGWAASKYLSLVNPTSTP